MIKRKVLYSALYSSFSPFHVLVKNVKRIFKPTELQEIDSYLVVWGGEDIATSLYNEVPNKFCAGNSLSSRDIFERDLILKAIELKIPVIGICRGAQLACALLGGKLVQHVNNHGSDHLIATNNNKIMSSSSLHHQMMIPAGQYQILAESYPAPLSLYYIGENELHLNIKIEPEIVLWPDQLVLGIQGHPEFMSYDSLFVQHCLQLVQETFNEKF